MKNPTKAARRGRNIRPRERTLVEGAPTLGAKSVETRTTLARRCCKLTHVRRSGRSLRKSSVCDSGIGRRCLSAH